jgi:23S rRNA (cytosine1962-C5)-methyltransferase
MDQLKDLIVKALQDHFCRGGALLATGAGGGDVAALQIIERNDAPVRRAEGMELQSGLLSGEAPNEIEIEVAGLRLQIDPLHGQKTGFYLDQLPNYALVAQEAKGRRVLDCFANEGTFALACARAGASEVVAVEAGAENVKAAEQNSARNQLTVRWLEQDVFQYLRGAERAEEIST